MTNTIRYFTKENTWLPRHRMADFGWGNGYVVIPQGHPFHGKHYDEIHELFDIDVNGGLTFARPAEELTDWPEITEADAGCWVIGFDTCHLWDTLEKWTKENVEAEAQRLIAQVIEASTLITDK